MGGCAGKENRNTHQMTTNNQGHDRDNDLPQKTAPPANSHQNEKTTETDNNATGLETVKNEPFRRPPSSIIDELPDVLPGSSILTKKK